MSHQKNIILGIDPGTLVTGYGILECSRNDILLISSGILTLKGIQNQFQRLERIFNRIDQLIREYHPKELAVEAPFYGKNVQSMLKLGRAQGVALAAALSHALAVEEYSPRKVKQAITGNGNASKEQIASFLTKIISFSSMPEALDATDAIAVAVCHHFQKKPVVQTKSYNSWKDFMNKNPGRIQ
jgi:crossover junction endodeoxyribonuclease RuvC